MKRIELNNIDIANTINYLREQHKDVIQLLCIYKEALREACIELSSVLENNNPKIDENYWLLVGTKTVEKIINETRGNNESND